MAPTLILIRHAEALHNYTLHDPPLTTFGLETQCATLKAALESHSLAQKAELIIVSPMRRTIQTAEVSLDWLIARGVPIVARAEWQENTVNNIDTGRLVLEIKEEFPNVDVSSIDPVFPAKEGLYEFSKEALIERGLVARKWLKDRKEKVIIVVGHDGFMRVGICNRKFGNADFRVFDFDEKAEAEDGLKLVEWEETERNGGGLGTSPKGVFGWLPNDFKYMPKKPEDSGKMVG